MTQHHPPLFALSAALTALACWVLFARRHAQPNRWFAAFTLSTAAWILGIASLQASQHLAFWGRFTFASAALIPAAFLGFIRCFPNQTPWFSRRLLTIFLAPSLFLALASVTTASLVEHVERTPRGFIRDTGPLYPAFIAFFLATWLMAGFVFIEKWPRARGLARAQLHYLAIGVLLSLSGAGTTNLVLPLVTGESAYSWLGPYFSLLLFAVVAHAIIRHRLLDLRLVVGRTAAFTLAGTLFALAAFFIARFLAPSRSLRVPLDIFFGCLAALLILVPPVSTTVRRLTNRYFNRGDFDAAMGLPEATRRLSRLMQPVELCAELRATLLAAFRPAQVAVILSPDGSVSDQLKLENQSLAEAIRTSPSLIRLLDGLPAPSVLLVHPAQAPRHAVSAHEELRAYGIDVVLSLGRRGDRLATVFLGEKLSGDAYYSSDLAFLEAIADITSVALENALLYRQRIHMLEYSSRLLESLSSAVVAIDAHGYITSFNPAATALFDHANFRKGAFLDVLPQEVAWALALTSTGAWLPRQVEATIYHPSKGPVPVIVSAAPLREDPGTISGALAVVTDFSTIKALEHHKRRLEHLTLMARFYAGLAHEIRSPLASISNFIAMLPDRFDDPEYRDTATRLLPLEVARIVRLADRLRMMAPSENGRLSHINLASLLRDIVALHGPAAQEKGLNVALSCPEYLPPILGDSGQLVQLFVNLLNNAVDATDPGGEITITASLDASSPMRVVVDITDSGHGIDPSIRARVFEPFFTTKATGTGLGLSICREIAEFHQARLSLIPRFPSPGTVARVEFLLPVTHPSPLPSPTESVRLAAPESPPSQQPKGDAQQ